MTKLFLKLFLIFALIAACAFGQQSTNQLRIIPSANRSSQGSIVLENKDSSPNTSIGVQNWYEVITPALTAGSATVTLTPCPLGVAGASTAYYVHLSGGGAGDEAALITGGTCTSTAATGTLIFTAVSSRTTGYTIASASGGIQEAILAVGTPGPGSVVMPAGTFQVWAPITIATRVSLEGQGKEVTLLQNMSAATDCVRLIGNAIESPIAGMTMGGFSIFAGTYGTNLAGNTSTGTGLYVQDAWDGTLFHNLAIRNHSTGIHHVNGWRGNYRDIDIAYYFQDGFRAEADGAVGSGSGSDLHLDRVFVNNNSVSTTMDTASCAFNFPNWGGFYLNNLISTSANRGLCLVPRAPHTPETFTFNYYGYIADSEFDTSASDGIVIDSSNGPVWALTLTNLISAYNGCAPVDAPCTATPFAVPARGLFMTGSSNENIRVNGGQFRENGGDGIWVDTGGHIFLSNVSSVGNSQSADNTFDGIHVSSGVSNLTIGDSLIGHTNTSFTRKTKYGIDVAGAGPFTCHHITYVDNGTADLIGTCPDGSTGLPGANSTSVTPTNPLLLYAHFRDDDVSLYMDYSRDYLKYHPVSKHALVSETNLRDVSVMWDGSTFWFLASAEGVEQSDGTYRAYEPQLWSSTDLIHFTPRIRIDLSSFVTTGSLAGAPEWYLPQHSGDAFGFWVHAGTALAPWFFTFNPATDIAAGVGTPTAGQVVTVNGTTAVFQGQPLNIFDFFPYYDAGSATYYLIYVDFADATNPAQRLAYATSSTQLGTYTQQHGLFNGTAGTGDWFGFTAFTGGIYQSAGAEGPAIVPLADSVARYGIAGCVRVYADTWTYQFGAGLPTITGGVNNYPGIGNRIYQWKYEDTCPASAGADPFGVIEPSKMEVNVAGDQVTLQSGPSFSYLSIGGTLSLNGHNYTIATIPTPSLLTLTSPIADINNTGFFNLPVYVNAPMPVEISNGEQGTVISITDQATANIVYKAEDYWRDDSSTQGRLAVGGKGTAPYTITAQSNFAFYGLANDEPPTFAAGGPDQGARYDTKSFALLSSCGVATNACPQPKAGEANWISRYSGFAPSVQLDNSNLDTGESSIGFSNAMTVFGLGTTTASSEGKKAIWRVGSNNQFFGPLVHWNGSSYDNGVNVANNWFYIYNSGLGPLFGTNPTITNSDFEAGSLAGWGTTGTVTINAANYHYGAYSAKLTPGSSISRAVTVTPNTMYVITAWVKSDSGSTTGIYEQASYGTGLNLATYNCNLSSSTLDSCLSIGQWTQIGFQYASDGSGAMNIGWAMPSGGTGNSYLDDVQMYAYNSPAGAFAFGISPSTGEVRANYGITLGQGDSSFISTFPNVNMDSSSPGVVNIGDGTLGHRNAAVLAAAVNLQTFHAPAFDDLYASARLEFAGGAALNDIGAGLIFGQQFDSTAPTDLRRTGGIYGYKQEADTVMGGGLAFYVQPKTSGLMFQAALMRDNGVVASLSGFGIGPLGGIGDYINLYAPSPDVLTLGDGSFAACSPTATAGYFGNCALVNTGDLYLNGTGSLEEGTFISTNAAIALSYNAVLRSGTPKALTTGNRVAYLDMGNAGWHMNITSTTQTAGASLSNALIPLSGDVNGGVFFNATTGAVDTRINYSSPSITSGNKLEIIGVSGVDSGNAFSSATSTDGIETYWGSKTGVEGFLGTFTNNPFALRTNNTDRLSISASGTVTVAAGSSSAITCTPHNVTGSVVGGSGGTVTISVCTNVDTNSFSGGIKY